ncbi:MAG: glycerol acyltransferase [Betaproteobacteria bacterium HGW-Betaproteobacteria-4]|jgi:1-acyl-sn-glycerol-3-phosphate acyltransferase|nr:MAG: glycerol acyltransferase [Betaproteobacteria bacterium HGW-Betaproteobacteria-4]
MLKTLSRSLLKLFGWTVIEPPARPARAVLAGYPHTSNWDGVIALFAKLALGLDARWVAKDSLFCGPLDWIFRRLGGIPIKRNVRNGFVAEMVAQFASSPDFLLVIAPEGTRSLTQGWKSGFYRIALQAKVPVALAFVDYSRRQAGILAYLTMTGDPATDIAAIAAHYEGRVGKHPELAAPIRWLD